MENITALRSEISDAAKDIRLNLSNVLQSTLLNESQSWMVALTSSYFLRCRKLSDAILADASSIIGEAGDNDCQAAAAIMGMNTVYYRFRHMIGKESYHQRRASLRMNHMMNPETNKTDFELCSMACAALAGCEACIKAHEETLLGAGLSEDHVHEVVRIAAVIQGAVVALS